jgi:hypothetical protein
MLPSCLTTEDWSVIEVKISPAFSKSLRGSCFRRLSLVNASSELGVVFSYGTLRGSRSSMWGLLEGAR